MNIYVSAAKKYKPIVIGTIFIAESLPEEDKNGVKKYFYFPDINQWDYLFKAIMKEAFPDETSDNSCPLTKMQLLDNFKANGYFLIDACEFPINKFSEKIKKQHILNNYSDLKKRLKLLVNEKKWIISKNEYI